MTDDVDYSRYHPRWLRTPVSTYWWLERRQYLSFILRELSSLGVAWFVVYLLMLVAAVNGGAADYQAFMDWSAHPLVVSINLVSLAFLIFHAITWFNLAPKAMVMRIGRKRVPASLIAASNYGAWVMASAVVAWLLLRGP